MIKQIPVLHGPDLSGGAAQCVYFVQPEGRPFMKIGHGKPIWTRLSQIQCGSPERLHVKLLLAGGGALEQAIHNALAGTAVRSEWFHITPELIALMTAIESAISPDLAVADFTKKRIQVWRDQAEAGAAAADALIATILPLSSAGKAA